jgi:fimbrial chaperone protein
MALVGVAVLGLVALAPSPLRAFQLVPIVQDFDPTGRGATRIFRLENPQNREQTVTVRIVTRAIAPDGSETNEETEDFIAFPTEAIIPPGGVQIVRVQYIGNPSPERELAYRIIAESAPIAGQIAQASQVLIALRYVGSIYVVPRGAQARLALESATQTPGPDGTPRLEIVVANDGTAHGITAKAALRVRGGGVARELPKDAAAALESANILAGGRRRFLLPWPAGIPLGPIEADLQLDAER